MRNMKTKKGNGTPACAGVTVFAKNPFLNRSRHARAGGHPISYVSRQAQGFTLVELSIVLVIIGLIIGGVLTGQQIIQNARITRAINDIQSYQAQFQTYAQNYGALPGDDPAATTRFTTATALANGNGDGIIEGGAFDTAGGTTDEALLVWAHLRAAGLLKNQVNGAGNTAIQPPNPFNGVYGIQNGAFGTAMTSTVLCMNNVPVSAAEAIDARLDDGSSNTGNIMASETTVTATVAAAYGNVQTYTMCIRM